MHSRGTLCSIRMRPGKRIEVIRLGNLTYNSDTSPPRIMKPLLSLLKNDPSQIDRLSVQQILALCGDGKLTDGSECSRDLREYLQIAKSADLIKYVQTCLQSPFDRSGHALQDVINQLGRRLDYTVENGLYQGRSNGRTPLGLMDRGVIPAYTGSSLKLKRRTRTASIST